MSVRLILMRHAKSSWSQPVSDDHSRGLNDRGRRSATALGNWLRANGYVPDQIMCSSATRCRETCHQLELHQGPDFIDALYLAPPEQMLRWLRMAQGRTVLMLGHNPGIAELAGELLETPVMHERFSDYPTGATLVADFPAQNWPALVYGTGQAVDFVIPRELLTH